MTVLTTLIEHAQAWKTFQNDLPKKSARSAHDTLRLKAKAADLKKEVETLDINQDFPTSFALVKIQLLRNATSLKLTQASPKGRAPLTLTFPFKPMHIATVFGQLLAWARILPEPGPLTHFLYLDTYKNCQVRQGTSPVEALFYDIMSSKDISSDVSRELETDPLVIMEKRKQSSFGLGSTQTFPIPSQLETLLSHPIITQSHMKQEAAETAQNITTQEGCRDFTLLKTILEKKRFGLDIDSVVSLSEDLTRLITLLDGEKKSTQPNKTWIVLCDDFGDIQAPTAREALLVYAVQQLLKGHIINPYEAQVLEKTNVYHGQNLDLIEA